MIDIKGLPIPMTSGSKEYMKKAIFNDTLFLSNRGIVDYSILVGIDEDSRELIIGIIDYLHQYTWDKQIENSVKLLGKIAGKSSPTVLPPKDYKKRFRDAMERYFIDAPSRYIQPQSEKTDHSGISQDSASFSKSK